MSGINTPKSSNSHHSLNNNFDDAVLFGLNSLVNELKIKDTEIDRKSNNSHGSRKSKKTYKQKLPPFDNFTSDKKQSFLNAFDTVSVKSSKSNNSRKSAKWSQSSGRKDNDFNPSPNNIFNELLGETNNKSILPDSEVYENKTIRDTEMNFNYNQTPNPNNYNYTTQGFTTPINVNTHTVERTPEEEIDDKIKLLNQYEALVKKIKDREVRQFGMHSNADDIRLEIRKLRQNKKRDSTTKYMRIGTIGIAKGIEQIFNFYPLFGWDLNGFATHLRHNIDDFDDIFDELYDKYSSSGKAQPPEMRFLYTFIGTLVSFVFANSAPKALLSYLNNGNKGEYIPSNGHMAPPEMDPETEEMILRAQERKNK
jgi:hypothetical protein